MTKDTRPIIALDVDGVLIDSTDRMIKTVNLAYNSNLTREDITDFSYANLSPRVSQRFMKLWHSTDYYSTPLEPGFEEMQDELHKTFRVIAVSTPMDSPLHLSTKWGRLKNLFGINNIYLCKDKSLINADLLVEDNPSNITQWLSTGRPCIIKDQPWNRHYQETLSISDLTRVRIVHALKEIPDAAKDLLELS